MGGFMKKMGFNLEDDEQYARAFQKGVLLKQFGIAADLFDKAAKKYAEKGNTLMATKAAANALLYHYLVMKDVQQVTPLLQTLLQKLQDLRQQGIEEIEEIGSQTNLISIRELCAELDCRIVEVDIIQTQNDYLRSRDLHKTAADKFQAMRNVQLKTYQFIPAPDGHNENAVTRHFFHCGMNSYYNAMLKKNYQPSEASDDLAQAKQFFQRCSDQTWLQRVTPLFDNWRLTRTCWLCHREMQGNELHFSMSQADIAPYIQQQVEKSSQNSMSEDGKRIVVCAPCGSMVMYKARHEADIVRRELNAKLDKAMDIIQAQHERISRLERQAHHH